TPTAVRGTPRRAQVLLRPSWGRASKVLACVPQRHEAVQYEHMTHSRAMLLVAAAAN
ncbi:unnamed protein product, partial [Pylaiella littoralis]